MPGNRASVVLERRLNRATGRCGQIDTVVIGRDPIPESDSSLRTARGSSTPAPRITEDRFAQNPSSRDSAAAVSASHSASESHKRVEAAIRSPPACRPARLWLRRAGRSMRDAEPQAAGIRVSTNSAQ
jgi:hypothetical protein